MLNSREKSAFHGITKEKNKTKEVAQALCPCKCGLWSDGDHQGSLALDLVSSRTPSGPHLGWKMGQALRSQAQGNSAGEKKNKENSL